MNATAQASSASAAGPKLDNRRVLAGVVDLAVVLAGALAILYAADALSGDRSDVQGALGAVILGWALYYYFALESGGGQTLGKKLMNLRVVRTDGSPAGMREIAVRTVLRVVDGVGVYIVGLIVMLATGQRRQRLGDLAAGTLVVDATAAPTAPAATAEPVEAEEDAPAEEDSPEESPEAAEAPEDVHAEPEWVEPEAVEVEPEPEEEPMPELSSPAVQGLASDVEAVQSEPGPSLEPPTEPEDHEEDEDAEDEPMTVRSVETVSAIDLVMGGAPADDSSPQPQDPEAPAPR